MIHGVAVDAGSGLEAAIRTVRGADARPDDLMTFKRTVLTTLGTTASTVLIDATCGPDLLSDYPDGCAPMMAYEADVYRMSEPERMTVLPDNLTVADYPKLGVKQLKFFVYYAPNDDPDLNKRKQDLVAEVGEACAREGLRFLMEPLVYDREVATGTKEYALLKPELVRRATETFAAPRFKADVLKVEIPVDLAFVEGFGEPVMSRAQALDAFVEAGAAAAGKKLVYLSAGVAFEWFEASLRMAGEAKVDFDGFMCGRAIWFDAVEIFGNQGEAALQSWLLETGQQRLQSLIAAL